MWNAERRRASSNAPLSGEIPTHPQQSLNTAGKIEQNSKPPMKNTKTKQEAVQKAGRDFITKMMNRYARMEALSQEVTEDDLATELEAEILAELDSLDSGRGPSSEPPQPTPTASGVILPFPQNPSDLPLSA